MPLVRTRKTPNCRPRLTTARVRRQRRMRSRSGRRVGRGCSGAVVMLGGSRVGVPGQGLGVTQGDAGIQVVGARIPTHSQFMEVERMSDIRDAGPLTGAAGEESSTRCCRAVGTRPCWVTCVDGFPTRGPIMRLALGPPGVRPGRVSSGERRAIATKRQPAKRLPERAEVAVVGARP